MRSTKNTLDPLPPLFPAFKIISDVYTMKFHHFLAVFMFLRTKKGLQGGKNMFS
jgi:hypothetical protein